MKKFIKTTVPTATYQDVQRSGERWIVHLEPVENQETESTECYEIIVDEEPDLTELGAELREWKAYMAEKELNIAKIVKIQLLDEYDKSSNVNSFTIGGIPMWLTVEERQQIATQISANEAVGRTTMTRWFGGNSFTFPISVWKQMLVALEVYAGDAINVTESHRAAINALTSVADVEAYDITTGYPTKIVFASN